MIPSRWRAAWISSFTSGQRSFAYVAFGHEVFVYKMTKYKVSFLGENCNRLHICNSNIKKKDWRVWRTEMLQYLVLLALLTSSKFCDKVLHVIVHDEKNVFTMERSHVCASALVPLSTDYEINYIFLITWVLYNQGPYAQFYF